MRYYVPNPTAPERRSETQPNAAQVTAIAKVIRQRCTSGADCAECAAVYMRPNGTVYMVCLKEAKRVLQCRGDEEWVPKEAFE
jgi:hypothetical protein